MKKAQVTLFIIIGLVIVISAGLFFTLKGSIEKKEIAPGVSMIVEELPSDFLPIKPYVEKCIEKTAKEGLVLLGQKGGYIYTDKLNPGQQPTEGDSVRFSKQSEMVVPYWFYMAAPNECTGECKFEGRELPIGKSRLYDSVEAQLGRYIDENIKFCIDDFKSIKELGFDVEEKGNAKADAIVTEKDIVVKLDYPLIISRSGSRTEMSSFYVILELNLNNIYKMAEYITDLEEKYRFLEKSTLNFIVGFSGKDSKKLPPMSDSSFELNSKVRWRKSNVKNNLKNILSGYIPLLRMVDTINWVEIDTGNLYSDGLYNYGLAIPNNSSINNLAVNFNYLDFWDVYFDLNCNGEICEPESGFTDLLPIGMQRYNFAYDVSYPVLVEISDPSAFNDEGYSFSFMLESNTRNNRAMPALFEPLDSASEQGSMLCEENKRTSGNVKISVVNSLDGSNVDGAEILYTCIDSCYIGDTKEGVLDTPLPICFGGALSVMKDGYETKFVQYDTSLGKKGELKIGLEPMKEFSVEVRKKEILKNGAEWQFTNAESEIGEKESAIVTLRKSSYDTNSGYNIIEFTKGSNESVSVSEGLYEIEISLIDDNSLYIPKQTKEFSGEKVHIQEFNQSSFVKGRTVMNYTFTKEDMSKSKIIFYALSAEILKIPENERSVDDLNIMTKFDDYSKKYYYELRPRTE